MPAKYFHLVFLIILFTISISESQIQTLGGCGSSFTYFQPGDTPIYGAGNNQWYGNLINGNAAPYNVLNEGIWCGTRSRKVGANQRTQITCSSSRNSGVSIGNWVDNLCNTNYNFAGVGIDPVPQITSAVVTGQLDQYSLSYNLCENVTGATGGAFFSEFNIGLTVSGIRMNFYPQATAIVTQTVLPAPRVNSGIPYTRCSSYHYFVQDGATIYYNTYNTGTNTFTFNAATYPGFTVLSWMDNLNMGFFRNTTHMFTGTINQTALTFFDSMRFPAGACTPVPYSQMNPLTGYLYTICFTDFNTGNNQSTLSTIYQVNLTNYHFIRSKVAPYAWNYRNVFIGVNHQLMTAMSNAASGAGANFTTPLLYCIADPYNPVFVTQPTLQPSVVAPNLALTYRIAANAADSHCFPTTYFTVQTTSLSDFGGFFDYCGSAVFNNATECNTATTGSGCCAQNCVPQSVGSICLNSTLCTNSSVCSSNGTCTVVNLSNTTTCGNGTTCGNAPLCNGAGTCNAGVPFVINTTCANSTSCINAAVCNGTSLICPNATNKANTTTCGNGTSCGNAPLCNGLGSCNAGVAFANNTICANSSLCVNSAVCNGTGLICPNATNKVNTTTCGNSTSCGNAPLCDGSGSCNAAVPFANNTICTNATDCMNAAVCNGTGLICPAVTNQPNGTFCGTNATECKSHDFCINGFCSNTTTFYNNTVPCGQNVSICQAISFCPGISGTCNQTAPATNATKCANATICMQASFCNNFNGTCPNQLPVSNSTICANETACLNPSFCDGSGNCPVQTPKSNTTICGLNATDCLNPSFCNGFNDTCIQQPFFNSSVSCGLNATDCLAQSFCPGTNQTCVQKPFFNSSVQCGLSPTDCLAASFCPGTNQTCVQQPFYNSSVACGLNATDCLSASFCPGTNQTCMQQPFYNSSIQCGLSPTDCLSTSFCPGTNQTCVQKPFFNSSVSCGLNATECLAQSFCPGTNQTCVQKPFYNSSVSCGVNATDCLAQSFCPGTNQTCAQQPFFNSSVQCGLTPTDCLSASFCPGTNQTCVQQPFFNSSVQCGLTSTDCLGVSFCPGTNQTCVQKPFYNSSVSCGLNATDCLAQSFCPGTNQTCIQQPFYNSSVQCGLNSTECLDPSFCPGTNQTCMQQPFYNSSVECGLSPDICIPTSFCFGNNQSCDQQFNNNSITCFNETDCKNASFCTGFNGTCPDQINKPNGTFCGMNFTCFGPDFCIDGSCVFNPIPIPPDPINFTATTINETAIDLTWQSGGGSTSEFQIAYQIGNTPPPDCNSSIVIPPTSITGAEYLVTGLIPETNYSFRICAINCNDTQAFSNGTTASNMTFGFPIPPDPTNCTTTVVSEVEIDLSWLSGGGSTIGFQIAYLNGSVAPADCMTGNVIPYSVITDESFPIVGLVPNTTYSFLICAINADPNPDFSSPGLNCSNTTSPNSCFNQTDGTPCSVSVVFATLRECKDPDLCFNDTCVSGALFPNGTLCGLNGTECQPQSFCNAFNPVCPQLPPLPNGTFCGDSATECKNNNFCILGNCTEGELFNTTVQCGILQNDCIGSSFCSGVDGNCSQTSPFNTSVQCGLNATECQSPSFCNGINITCPQMPPLNTSFQCGINATQCINASFCDGSGNCSQTAPFPNTTPCGIPSDECLNPSFCSGVNETCLQKPFFPNTTQCGASPNECTPISFCFGFNQSCNELPAFNTSVACGLNATECVNSSFCDGLGSCNQSPFYNSTVICGPNATLCQPQSFCSGTDQNCFIIPPFANGTFCGPNSTECLNGNICLSGICVSGGFLPNGTSCGPSPIECQSQMTCLLGNCTKNPPLANGTVCGGGTAGKFYCIVGGVCDGSSDFCPNNTGFLPNGTPCFVFNCINGTCDGSGICNLNESTSHCGNNESIVKGFVNPNFASTDDSFYYLLIPIGIFGIMVYLFYLGLNDASLKIFQE